MLKGSPVKVCTVIGFPLGANTPEVKAFEADRAISDGALEVDMVMNIGAVKDGDYGLVERDIRAVVDAAKGKARVKVIIETCLLTDEEKVRVCLIAKAAGADFVKTSSGFSKGGATAEDVALMKRTVGPGMEVKASTGVRTAELVIQMVNAGATRIGTGSGVKIVTGE
jgi:deoxyribose-phosphate aldolase